MSYNDYDFSDEKKEYEVSYSEEIRKKYAAIARKRAQEHGDNWAEEDMDATIRTLLPNPQMTPPTIKGKEVFCSKNTSLTICYDLHGDYFTVMDEKLHGADKYRDINGNSVLNYKTSSGKIRGRDPDERKRITHFKRRKQ